jgi:Fe-S-cluster-containing dehydrogenase component
MKPYELVIDEEACWGCRTCEVACMQEFNLNGDIQLITVGEAASESPDGRPQFTFQVNLCRHCDDPPCVDACPEAAIVQRQDGIVVLSEELCTGCQACLDECPYEAIAFDAEQSVARKCNLCHHRVDHGLMPACADNVCLAHCIYFGSPEAIEVQRRKRLA